MRRSLLWLLVWYMAVSVCALAATAQSEPDLMKQATRLITITPATNGRIAQPWLSDHELLHFKDNGLYRYDLTTQSDTALPALTQQVKTSSPHPAFINVSPTGQWAVWGMFFAASVDGINRYSWPRNSGTGLPYLEPYWCADGQHWIEMEMGYKMGKVWWTQATVYDVTHPQIAVAVSSLPAGLRPLEILRAVSENSIIARTLDSSKASSWKQEGPKHSDGTITITGEVEYTNRGVQNISVWSLHNPHPLHHWIIYLPGTVFDVSVSPDGYRAVWLMAHPMGYSLWVSEIDGSHLRELGIIKTIGKKIPYFPSLIQWRPDRKAISFEYEGSLWSVPTE